MIHEEPAMSHTWGKFCGEEGMLQEAVQVLHYSSMQI